MTTIVYKDGILAGDSRTSIDRKFKCVHCNELSLNAFNTNIKIFSKFKTSFRDEKIIAVAVSGERHYSLNYVDLIRSGENLEELFRLYKSISFLHIDGACSILIVTDKSIFKLIIKNKELQVLTHSRNEIITMGSGGYVANFAITIFNSDAVEAIRAASISNDKTGGDISWVDCNSKDLKINTETSNDKDDSVIYFKSK